MRSNVTAIAQAKPDCRPDITAGASRLAEVSAAPVADPLLTPSDLAASMSISRSLAYLILKRGDLPVFYCGRLPRVRRSDLEAYMASLPTAPAR